MDVCIKNVDDEAWRIFKAESARRGFKMGEFFSEIIKENIKKESGWDILLNSKKRASKDTINSLENARRRFRKELKFK